MQISKASARVDEGNKHLEESIKEEKKNRKRKCCILLIVIVAAVVLVSFIPFIYICLLEQEGQFV